MNSVREESLVKATDIMTTEVITISSWATVTDAAKLMQEKKQRSLIVDREDEQDAYGIVTMTDIIYKVIAANKDPGSVQIREIMTKPCVVINPNLSLENVKKLFVNQRLHRAPVIQGKLLGIISISDLILSATFKAEELEAPHENTHTALRLLVEEYFEELNELIAPQNLDNLCSG